MKSAVIVFPGSNCDRDAYEALKKLGSKNCQRIWHQESKLDDDLDLIVIPGGFSYGDYLRSGAMASISPIMQEVKRLGSKGAKILGICNGFQVLTEAGLLEGVLLRNKRMKFICRDIFIRVENNETIFTKNYSQNQTLILPIAHMDGNYFADAEALKKLQDKKNIAFTYVSASGNLTDEDNPNGACHNIAGIFNDQKNILGMMPHPERAIDKNLGSGSSDGLNLFKSIFELIA
jgi:phosphoribosylformylglycinamidine synthase I